MVILVRILWFTQHITGASFDSYLYLKRTYIQILISTDADLNPPQMPDSGVSTGHMYQYKDLIVVRFTVEP